jgi:alkanesulfonate monooxygenase SsuD/methylene tetrahydromethanopterin reductase-like flavin-dependent oxidoreductase (luciferase family)
MGALTNNPAVFATCHVPTMHPVMAAKQAATIDHISGGRFTLNVVTGWYRPEIEMFGTPLLEHDTRYDMATEWIGIIKRLWTSEAEFDFEGKFYRIKGGTLAPKPLQKPHPVIMSAGVSPKGREFAAHHADVNFINLEAHDFEAVRARVNASRQTAWDECKREIQVWTNAYIFQGDTEADARAFYKECVFDKGDWAGVENLVNTMGINSQSIPAPILQTLKEHFIAGWVGYPLIGTKEQIVDGLSLLQQAGFDGIVLTWPRYVEDMKRFQTETFPLVQQAGLR